MRGRAPPGRLPHFRPGVESVVQHLGGEIPWLHGPVPEAPQGQLLSFYLERSQAQADCSSFGCHDGSVEEIDSYRGESWPALLHPDGVWGRHLDLLRLLARALPIPSPEMPPAS